MDPNKLTHKAQEALVAATQEAVQRNHPEVTSAHLLLVLLSDFEGVVVQLLKKLDISVGDLAQKTEVLLEKMPQVEGTEQRPISPELQKVLKSSFDEAKNITDEYVSREHLFLALLSTQCQVSPILNLPAINRQKILSTLSALRGSQKSDSQMAEDTYGVLEKYTTNLTSLARGGKLDPVIGRDEEIRRVMQILSRRTKNNPVLIGDPGVGKTAIVEGLAQRIVSGDVPESLRGRELLTLDLAALLAGAKFRGEFEDRLKAVLKDIDSASGHYLLFMDELHTLVGAGSAEGSVDAANILKPALARGQLHAIGATTLKEYRQYIEKDAALERRFQPVFTDQPSPEDSIAILRGLKERYELHHGVRITDDAILAAVRLSTRYIPDRFLPDKAIDLIDEATAALRMDIDSHPAELDFHKRRLTQIEIELQALKRDDEKIVKTRKDELEKELTELRENISTQELKWSTQKEMIKAIQLLKEQRDKLRLDLDRVERNVELEKAAEIKFGKLPEVENQLRQAEEKWQAVPPQERILRQEVTEEDIARVVSSWTSIPVSKLVGSEHDKLINLESEIGQRLVGQVEAVHQVANAIRRSRAGVSEEGRPIASFIFLGPTGVGKTELARSLADALFNDENNLVRIDLSEYQESHSIARLIGSPPGYIGHDEGGQLTEVVRRKPYSIVLFDELEKAHPDVFNLFLQILDEGRLTDSRGRTVNFKNTVIIMTSNLGSDLIQENTDKLKLNEALNNLLRSKFKPEFLNRVDQIIVFDPLNEGQLEGIVDIQLGLVKRRLSKQGIAMTVSPEAKKLLAKIGFDPAFGARPLKRAIQDHVLDELALQIIEGKIGDGSTVHVLVQNGKIKIS